MTTTRQREPVTEPAPRRRPIRRVAKWAGIVVAVLVVAVTAWWVLATTGTVAAPAPITVSAPTTTPVPVFGGDAGGPTADGCLAGSAALAAQQAAALTPSGAAGFVLTFARWIGQYPIPADTDTVLNQTVANPALRDTLHATMTRFAAAHDADGAPVTTVPGGADQWRVTADGAHTVTLDFTAYWHPAGAGGQQGQARSYSTVTLDNTSGHWVIIARSDTVPSDPWASMDAYPWQAYQGVC